MSDIEEIAVTIIQLVESQPRTLFGELGPAIAGFLAAPGTEAHEFRIGDRLVFAGMSLVGVAALRGLLHNRMIALAMHPASGAPAPLCLAPVGEANAMAPTGILWVLPPAALTRAIADGRMTPINATVH